jgi:predicted dehydrogenase
MIDLLRHLTGSPRTWHAIRAAFPPAGRGDLLLGDNVTLTCGYADGSVSTLIYTSEGHAAAGKERIELHWDGCTAIADDFRRLRGHGVAGLDASREVPDKGHRELLRRFVAHVRGEGPPPIPVAEILDASRFVLELDREIRGGPPAAAER